MAVPKRKSSKKKRRQRRAHHAVTRIKLQYCAQCGTAVPSHVHCPWLSAVCKYQINRLLNLLNYGIPRYSSVPLTHLVCRARGVCLDISPSLANGHLV